MAADKFMKKLSFLFLKDSDVKTTLVSTGFESSETGKSLITENNKTENSLIILDNKTDNSLIIKRLKY